MRPINFSAGPAALPEAVLSELQANFLDWHAQGASVFELPHRSQALVELLEETTQAFRALLNIPNHFHILFMHGGARLQFSAIPMNLLGKSAKAIYLNTGYWSEAAAVEAKRYGDISVPPLKKGDVSAASRGICKLNLQVQNPPDSLRARRSLFSKGEDKYIQDAVYMHYCDNETISGIEFPKPPIVENIPLVSDMSSNILSRPIDWKPFGLVYAGMQKNIGPAGLAVVVVREDLLDQAQAVTPSVLHYKMQVKSHSAYNTLPFFNIYAASLVFKWLQKQGGVEAISLVNQRKADKVYKIIDESHFYHNTIDKACRSRMNITFSLPNKILEEKFIAEARTKGFINLEGHGSVGGIRISLYNAISEEALDGFLKFMEDFAESV